MHACVFGMTGMGKTTTTAVLLEELMFRGAKTIVFDPHSDYVNIDQIRQDMYNQHFKHSVENDDKLRDKISEYRDLLTSVAPAKVEPWDYYDPTFKDLTDESINSELTTDNIFYRLLNFCSAKNRHLMIDSMQDPDELSTETDAVITAIKKLNLQQDLPQDLASRKLTIKFNAFPTLQKYPDRSTYFTIRLIEAMGGEGFSDVQVAPVIRWLSDSQADDLSDVELLDYLIERVGPSDIDYRSKPPIQRILEKAKRTVTALEDRDCQSLDISCFVNDFCRKSGRLGNTSTAIFDLSDMENNHARRALIYAVMEFAFEGYKSGRLVMGKTAHPVLFALEEARTLIPREEESSTSGEMHPATRAARLAARQIATEGRKMGMGLLVISQKPAAVDPLTVSQANTLILHRAINPEDQNYIRNVGESLSSEDLETLKMVEEGVAIVTGDALKTRIMSTLVKVRNRYSEPGTKKPTPIEDFWKDR